MKKYGFYFLLWLIVFPAHVCVGQETYTLVSWNIQHLGKSKESAEIEIMAKSLREADLVAIQEVVAGYGGAQAVARLAEALNRTGASWDYRISDPTSSTPHTRERYAFLWKRDRVRLIGRASLESNYAEEINREPYKGSFQIEGKTLSLINFHARPKQKQPEMEVKYFKYYPRLFPEEHLVFLGDFNLPQTHTVFNPLKKMGYLPALKDQKTSLKKKFSENGQYLANPLDNIFFHPNDVEWVESGVIDFTLGMDDLTQANQVSNHLPVFIRFYIKQ